MNPTRSIPVAFVALFGLASCKGGSAPDPIKLVPDQAKLIGSVDVKGLRTSKFYQDNKDKFENEDFKEVEEAAKGCKLDIDSFDKVIFGADPAGENFAVVISAKGLGNTQNLECLAAKVKEKTGEERFKVVDKDGSKVVEISASEGGGVGLPVGNDLLVVTSNGWTAAVKELIGGKGKAAVDGALKDIASKAPKDKQIWLAGLVTSDMAPALAGSPVEAIQAIYGGVDFSNGLAISLGGLTDAPEKASEAQKKLQEQFDQLKPMMAPMGVPAKIIESVKIEAAGQEIKVSMAASPEDLKALQEKVGKMLGGMGGPPPAAPMQSPPGAPPQAPPAAGGAPAAAPADAPAQQAH